MRPGLVLDLGRAAVDLHRDQVEGPQVGRRLGLRPKRLDALEDRVGRRLIPDVVEQALHLRHDPVHLARRLAERAVGEGRRDAEVLRRPVQGLDGADVGLDVSHFLDERREDRQSVGVEFGRQGDPLARLPRGVLRVEQLAQLLLGEFAVGVRPRGVVLRLVVHGHVQARQGHRAAVGGGVDFLDALEDDDGFLEAAEFGEQVAQRGPPLGGRVAGFGPRGQGGFEVFGQVEGDQQVVLRLLPPVVLRLRRDAGGEEGAQLGHGLGLGRRAGDGVHRQGDGAGLQLEGERLLGRDLGVLGRHRQRGVAQ